jgi:hypothetical protein
MDTFWYVLSEIQAAFAVSCFECLKKEEKEEKKKRRSR